MSQTWTTERVLALSPDDSSTKSGKDLAAPKKWLTLGADDRTVWGECQGSGSKPYQTEIELNEPAFKCTCPSRKFPCKHALGLFLMYAARPGDLTQSAPPQWVTDWLASRDKKTEQKAKKERGEDKPPDPTAQAKRAAEREAKVKAGVQELDIWIKDLLRSGLASAQEKPYDFWEGAAARMVDAQAPGLARMLRDMAGVASSGTGWQDRLLSRVSRLYLLLEGYKRLDSLSEPVRAEIRSLIGWTQDQSELLSQDGIRDRWMVLGQRVYEEDRLRVQKTWLWGRDSQKPAMILSFTHATQPVTGDLLAPGAMFDAEVAYFPGSYPLRALIKGGRSDTGLVTDIPGYSDLLCATAAFSEALSVDPWIDEFPVAVQSLVPAKIDDRWLLIDRSGGSVAIAPGFQLDWELVAVSGGHPISIFGIWNGENFMPYSATVEGRFYNFYRNGD